MNDQNNFALIPKPSSAVEKAAPGAKRILSGMVADTLVLAKPVFTVLVSAYEVGDLAEAIIKSEWSQKYLLRFVRFKRATELLKLAEEQSFDLIFLYLGDVEWDALTGESLETQAVKILGRLKVQYGNPIIATVGWDMTKQFEGTGVIFLKAPFDVEDFRGILKANLPAEIKRSFSVAVCGYSDEWFREMLGGFFQGALSHKYKVRIEPFIYGDELIKAAIQKSFELFLVFLNPSLPRKHDQPDALNQADTLEFIAHLKSNFQKPIFIISNEVNYSRTLLPLFMKAGANAFLGMPFSLDEINGAMRSCGMNPKQ